MVLAKKKVIKITTEQIEKCNVQLNSFQNEIDYDTKDYTLELINNKFKNGDFLFQVTRENIFGN